MKAKFSIKPGPEIGPREASYLLTHSFLLALLLMGICYWAARKRKQHSPNPEEPDPLTLASGIFFFCFGMTGVMILVNNNLARAFAIGATIALVRFKIKAEEAFGTSFLFAILTGMACGVERPALGWSMAVVFSLMQVVFALLKEWEIRRERPAQVAASENRVIIREPWIGNEETSFMKQ